MNSMVAPHSAVLHNPATPEAVAALCAHPRFAGAMRTSSAGLVSMYHGRHLLNWLMDDRGRVQFGYLALYLHVTRNKADPSSGLTPTRMKALCAELGICSRGRATAMMSLMRFSGYLAPEIEAADRRQRRLVATERLQDLYVTRWRMHFTAMVPLLPDGAAMLAALSDPQFVHFFVVAMVENFRAGFRPLQYAPGLGLFGERNAGILILASLLTAGEADDTMPPTRPVPLSISALARRFAVSRPHVLKLIRDAGREGSIERVGPDGEFVLLSPGLRQAAQNFFATMFLLFADCARRAMANMEKAGRAA
jgi:hypothetical protein